MSMTSAKLSVSMGGLCSWNSKSFYHEPARTTTKYVKKVRDVGVVRGEFFENIQMLQNTSVAYLLTTL
jgi:hypothetical protein